MSAFFQSHSAALGHAARRLAKKPFNTLLSALVIAIALTLPASFYVLVDNFSGLAQGVSGRPEISVFLLQTQQPSQVQALESRLRADRRISALRFVAREEALRQLAARGGFADVTSALPENPLPDAFVIEPATDAPQVLSELRDALVAMPEVGHVQLDSEWIERLHALANLGRLLALLLAALLGTALLIVTFNTIRLQILTLRHEIAVSLLLGATRPFVRRPFLYFGGIQGLFGGLLAWLALLLLMRYIGPKVQEFASLYNIVIDPRGPDLWQGLALCCFASVLGWSGAALSVMRHLHDQIID